MPQKTVKYTQRKNITSFIIVLVAILLLNYVAQYFYFRIDLTSDKRYTLSDVSRKIMNKLDDIVFVRVYLDGEMPVDMKKFQRAIREQFDELSGYSNGNLLYEFINPSEGSDAERDAIYVELRKKGMHPYTIQENDAEGGLIQRLLFPGAIMNYRGKETVINFIQDNPRFTRIENLNYAQQNLEFNIVSAAEQISRNEKPLIAFVEGHGELSDVELGDIMIELSNYYKVERVTLNGNVGLLDDCKAVIIAKPTTRWSEEDKLVIDQYIMNGGRTAWFVDAVFVHEDSLRRGDLTLGMVCDHNLNDQLFRYGVRINANVIQDLQCVYQPVNFAPEGMPADFRPAPWLYFPLLIPPDDNPITKGLNLIRSQYPGVIDTVSSDGKVKKTFLLHSSEYSKVKNAPLMISLSQIEEKITEMEFNSSFLPVAALLEGEFQSPFRNRIVSQFNHGKNFDFKTQSKDTKMIIVSDGDIIRNDIATQGNRVVPRTLGYDRYMNQFFGNKDFVKNVINYIAGEDDLMEVRNHEYIMRLLDKSKVAHNHTRIILINTVLPIILVLLSGIFFMWWRRRKYTR